MEEHDLIKLVDELFKPADPPEGAALKAKPALPPASAARSSPAN